MGGKSSRVSPIKSDQASHREQHHIDSLDDSYIDGTSSAHQPGGESSHSTSSAASRATRTISGANGGGPSRPDSQKSKTRPISSSLQMSRYGGKLGLNPQVGRNTGSRDMHRAKLDRLRSFQGRRVDPFTPSELANSYKSNFVSKRNDSSANGTPQRQSSFLDTSPCEQSTDFDDSASYMMKINSNTITSCPSCGTKYSSFVHVPHLLLCGHTFCSSCIEYALKHDPHSLKCGHCFITTPVDPQSRAEDFLKNEAMIDLIDSKEFTTAVTFQFDRCAECERKTAVVFCSECSASYCESCNQQQHTGSKVRAKHKPVSISLKPRPQPTCKKHPGQSCVLYCETERQPMCVLCKFYGQHKFHNYQILNNSATAYRHLLTMKLEEIEKMEERLSDVAHAQFDTKNEIRNKAKESQEKLEKHFADTRKEVLTALEHREATLLCLLDKQVEMKEMILEEQRLELASARSRAITTKEEITKFLDVNPVSALLSRKHLDSSLDSTLKQTTLFPGIGEEENEEEETDRSKDVQSLPVGLGHKGELTLKLQQALNQHGVVLQLPERIQFVEVRIHSKSIFIQWEVPEQNLEVTFDRTRNYSLHCFADVPLKFKKDRLQTLNRRILNVQSSSPGLASHADSGYQEGGGSDTMSQNSDGKLPLIPPSMRTNSSHNVSLVIATPQLTSTLEEVTDSKPNTPNLNIQKSLKPQSIKLGQSTAAARASGALLKLPALLTKTNEDINLEQEDVDVSSSNNNFKSTPFGGGINKEQSGRLHLLSPPSQFTDDQTSSQTSSTSSSNTTLTDSGHTASHNSANNTKGINIGLCHRGYAFEEIYSGQSSSFTYSGIIPGATYYFRIRCYNAIGAGPWSDTYKCKIAPSAIVK